MNVVATFVGLKSMPWLHLTLEKRVARNIAIYFKLEVPRIVLLKLQGENL